MENNKLLIGLQFIDRNGQDPTTGKMREWICHLELYVVRDMLLGQLLDGVYYGLKKVSDDKIYGRCLSVFEECREQIKNGRFTNITMTSYKAIVGDTRYGEGKRFIFTEKDLTKPLCDLGIITSTKIVFDVTGAHEVDGQLKDEFVIPAFNPNQDPKIAFPEYNISTRQRYQFDTKPVELIAPTDPPKKPGGGLIGFLIPVAISTLGMLLARGLMTAGMNADESTAMMGMNNGSIAMIGMTLVMSAVSVATTFINRRNQLKAYKKDLEDWRVQYENYINATIGKIKERQRKDAGWLNVLYPDMESLIEANCDGVYSLNEDIYSRAPQDSDFLTFRIGQSQKCVPSFFEIKGEEKDEVFSEAFYTFKDDTIRLYLREELPNVKEETENLCKLPCAISQEYEKLEKAPLLYSLKNKGCLGIIDEDTTNKKPISNYFITRMIFELCYYHSPENLQFVVFFPNNTDRGSIDDVIALYKFMPHFRGLFPDKSQFVFDKENAALVMSSLLNIMNERQQDGSETKTPHIVVIVFDEHGLKEHAFAEYLPDAPEEGETFKNSLGLSFVYVTKHKEYLPAYCDDIVDFSHRTRYGDTNNAMTLIPHDDFNQRKTFYYEQRDRQKSEKEMRSFQCKYETDLMGAFRFLSSVYYAKIAQNGKVPSSVSVFETSNISVESLQTTISNNWDRSDKSKPSPVTKSLRVPIGKTEDDLAYLDLHEKSDGPHMLVAGTTGSGKTEAIITYLLGLCMQYPPDEVNLLLVDMKGGGFTKRIGDLPHVVGSVTDVDGDENGTGAEYMLNRFLFAMKSEIKRRKLLLNKLHVDSLDSYIKAYQDIDAHIKQKKLKDEDAQAARETADNPEKKLTHLILVVDEFTELKRFSSDNSDIDFMSEITTIARVGRSLGLHIILISQNIEGAITDDIRANTNARYCLKVATKQASKEMIGTELAASAYMPVIGRAYLKVSSGDKLTYFQSAYSGGSVTEEAKSVTEEAKVEITLASKNGKNSCFYLSSEDKKRPEKNGGVDKNQLDAICEAIHAVSENKNITAPKMVFSKPLASHIAWDRAKDTVIDLNKRKGNVK